MTSTRETTAEYRQRAAELRILASKMRDQTRREMVLDIAASYDKIADEFESLDQE